MRRNSITAADFRASTRKGATTMPLADPQLIVNLDLRRRAKGAARAALSREREGASCDVIPLVTPPTYFIIEGERDSFRIEAWSDYPAKKTTKKTTVWQGDDYLAARIATRDRIVRGRHGFVVDRVAYRRGGAHGRV
jgi:hypothetical protein